jgi:nucleoside-diphosphate kinase
MANEERHCFITEWYDTHAEIKRQYQLMHYAKDNTIEMYDIKNKRKFLNRTRLHQMPESLLIGTKLSIHARQHCIVDYGDEKTRKEHTGFNETTVGIIKEQKYIGRVINHVISNDLKVTNMKSVKMSPSLMNEYGLDQNSVVAIEVKGLEALQKFKQYQDNGLECIAAGSDEEACRYMALFAEDGRVESTCTSADGSTCAVIKPHAMKAAGNIIDEIINKYGQISAIKMISLDRKEAEEFYEVYRDVVAEYSQMVDELSSGPSIVIELSEAGKSLVQPLREFCGPADPKVAAAIRPQTVRARYGVNKVQNAIHCTDLDTDGAFESNFMFKVL